jgi:hypothetical protein
MSWNIWRSRNEGMVFLKRIITEEEIWIYHFEPESDS